MDDIPGGHPPGMSTSEDRVSRDASGHTGAVTAETRYARAADGTHIAYQATGSGPVDILLLRAWVSALEHEWQDPVLARAFRRLEATGRLIRLDRRGSGLSDRIRADA